MHLPSPPFRLLPDDPLLDRHPLLQGATGARLRRAVIPVRLPAGAVVIEEGQAVLRVTLLLAGSTRTSLAAADGREALTRVARAPDVLGALESIRELPSLVTVRAMEASWIASIPSAVWNKEIDVCPDLRRVVFDLIARDREVMLAQHRLAVFGALEQRLAALVHEYVRLYGLPTPSGQRIRIRARHEDLADALGVARRSVTRILTEWRALEILRHEQGHFVVKDIEGLERLASGEWCRADLIRFKRRTSPLRQPSRGGVSGTGS